MLFDYLIAASVAVIGMLGLMQWASEIVLLHTVTSQYASAEMVLRELLAARSLFDPTGWDFHSVCHPSVSPDPTGFWYATCESLPLLLESLPDYHFGQEHAGGVRLVWRGMQGQWMSLDSGAIVAIGGEG